MHLAIHSGVPHFAEPQHVGGPLVEPETRERFHTLADSAFDRNYLTNDGPLCRRLEEEVARRHQVKHALLMVNATIAQLVLMRSMGLGTGGGEALVAADTFISTAHTCEWVGLKPVFADIDSRTLGLDPQDMLNSLSPKTRVIIPTHVFGVMADLPTITRLAAEHGVAVLADAAHAFDCDCGGAGPGSFGVPEFVSLHATKFFSTIEGGAVLTNDDALASEIRQQRNFGYSPDGVIINSGTNAKVTEISAAFGLASLPALEERKRMLKEVREVYLQAFAGTPGIRVHEVDGAGRNNYRYFAVFIEEVFGAERDAVHQAIHRENVLTRLYFSPGCHRTAYFVRQNGGTPTPLPRADAALGSILCLPTSFVGIPHREAAARVAELLLAIRRQAGSVQAWWNEEKEKTR